MNEIKVGELLYYPLHGVGRIEEEVTLLLENQQRDYYKLYFWNPASHQLSHFGKVTFSLFYKVQQITYSCIREKTTVRC